jgi:hypothetical protein
VPDADFGEVEEPPPFDGPDKKYHQPTPSGWVAAAGAAGHISSAPMARQAPARARTARRFVMVIGRGP